MEEKIYNKSTAIIIEKLKDAGPTISMTEVAKFLNFANSKQLNPAADRGELPFVIHAKYQTNPNGKYRVCTERFIQYLIGKLDKEDKQ